MRTLAQMKTRLQELLRDARAEWKDADTELVPELQAAAAVLWRDLLESTRGRRCLRKYSTAASLVAEQEFYALPADCLLIDRVEVLWREETVTESERWHGIEYRAPAESSVRSGSAALFGSTGRSAGDGSLYWYDDAEEPDEIRIWPYLATVSEEQYRFRYYHEPVFPDAGDRTFNDPTTPTGTVTEKLPERAPDACVFWAAAMLSLEELEDGKPVGAFGAMYDRVLAQMIRTDAAGPARQPRHYITRMARIR